MSDTRLVPPCQHHLDDAEVQGMTLCCLIVSGNPKEAFPFIFCWLVSVHTQCQATAHVMRLVQRRLFLPSREHIQHMYPKQLVWYLEPFADASDQYPEHSFYHISSIKSVVGTCVLVPIQTMAFNCPGQR